MKALRTVLTVLSLTWMTVAAPADPDPAVKKDDRLVSGVVRGIP
jgi:hypothetical protein